MILAPYIIEANHPVRRLFLQIPLVELKEYTHRMSTQIITLDISQVEEITNVLLGRPDWEGRGISNQAEEICSNLLLLMDFCGLVKDRKKIYWFEIMHSVNAAQIHSMYFESDNGSRLNDVKWQDLHLENVPFNLSRYASLFKLA